MNADQHAPGQIRVILVEDDELLRLSLQRFLTLSHFAVTAVGDSLSCYRELAERHFDIAIIDLGLPDQRGEVLIDYLRRNSSISIVVITARDTLDTRIDCYRTGADLFLSKPVQGQELAAALGSLAARAQQNHRPIPQVDNPANLSWRLEPSSRTLISPDGQRLPLTAKEWHLFTLLATNPSPTSRYELLYSLYQREDCSAQQALDTLLCRTRHKISDRLGIPQPILNDYGVGYHFAGSIRFEGD